MAERDLTKLRTVKITPDYTRQAAGSCLIECGGTRVICTASVNEGVPPFKKGTGCGWLTAEYAMLPASTSKRKERDGIKKDGRGVEIQRLIGRSLRQAVDLSRLGERTIYIDCDVLEADGGTRTASITGGFVALTLAVNKLLEKGIIKDSPVVKRIAAVSVGVVDRQPVLDLEYENDSRADVDMNVVMSSDNKGNMEFVEVQGTGEGHTFSKKQLDTLLKLAEGGIKQLMKKQLAALGERKDVIGRKPRLYVATHNFGKLKEIRGLLGERFDICSAAEAGEYEEPEETGESFAENAMIKAKALFDKTGCATLADDSGLMVDALGGRPGVKSARYAGVQGDSDANNAKLLEELKDVPAPRTARFVCSMCLLRPGHAPVKCEGVCEGEIGFEKQGEGGFGYDPLFVSPDVGGLSFAQAGLEMKQKVSHRAKALEKLCEVLDSEL